MAEAVVAHDVESTNPRLDVDAPIVEVTLLEDRAHVVRVAEVSAPAGTVTIRISGVAPVLSDKTCTASFVDHDGGGQVHHVLVARAARVLAQDLPEEIRKLEQQIESDQKEAAAITENRDVLLAEVNALGRLGAQSIQEWAEDAVWGKADTDRWAMQMQALNARESELRAQCVELEEQIARRQEKLANLEQQRAVSETPASRRLADLMVDASFPEAGTYKMRFEYVVPGACWRPYHIATLGASDERVVVECDGSVWQNTGEDWIDVQLYFSTQRASLGTEPPRLSVDLLDIREKPQTTAVETREEAIRTTGLGAGTSRQEVDEVPGIDDAGEIVKLAAESKSRVHSDGRPYRVPIFRFESEAQSERVLIPELTSEVVFKTTQSNQGKLPLLAGPVDLIRDCGLVGRTTVKYIAAGESFSLGWGPDGSLRACREHQQHEKPKGALTSWIHREHHVTVHLSNLGPEPRTVHVTERLPVSEVEKVQIKQDVQATTGQVTPDANGFLNWTVLLTPFGRDTIEFRHTLMRHKDVVGV